MKILFGVIIAIAISGCNSSRQNNSEPGITTTTVLSSGGNTPDMTVSSPTDFPTDTPTPLPTIGITEISSKDIWLKNSFSTNFLNDTTLQKNLFSFFKDKKIKRIYADVRIYLQGDSSQQNLLRNFITNAADSGFKIVFLFNDKNFAYSSNHTKALKLISQAITFKNSLSSAVKNSVDGIQFNIDIQNLPEWNSGLDSIANQYLDLMEKINSFTQNTDMIVDMCIQRFFDEKTIKRNGKSRFFSEWILDRAQKRIVILNLGDTFSILTTDIESEIAYARSIGKTIIVGFETSCTVNDSLSFCEEGTLALENTISSFIAKFKDNPAFEGAAVNDARTYKELTF